MPHRWTAKVGCVWPIKANWFRLRDRSQWIFRAYDTGTLAMNTRIALAQRTWRSCPCPQVLRSRLYDFIAFDRRSISMQMSRMFFDLFVSFTDPVGIDTLLILPL